MPSSLPVPEKLGSDTDVGAQALVAVAKASKFGLNDSKHSPATSVNRAKIREAKPKERAASAIQEENPPITPSSAKSEDATEMKSPGFNESPPSRSVSNEEKAKAYDGVMRAYPKLAAEMLKSYKTKLTSDVKDGEGETFKQGTLLYPFSISVTLAHVV